MPLSEHEQRLLDQIERELYAEDPKFASTVRGTRMRRPTRRRRLQGIALFVVGVAMLVLGVAGQAAFLRVAEIPWLSVLWFLVMFGGVLLAVTALGASGEADDAVPEQEKRAEDSAGESSGLQFPAQGSMFILLAVRFLGGWVSCYYVSWFIHKVPFLASIFQRKQQRVKGINWGPWRWNSRRNGSRRCSRRQHGRNFFPRVRRLFYFFPIFPFHLVMVISRMGFSVSHCKDLFIFYLHPGF